jgi:hypothetical protein
MTAPKRKQSASGKRKGEAGTRPAPAGKAPPTLMAPPKGSDKTETGQPGGGCGRVDITGTIAGNSRVDPDLMEGSPGYQESGDSEIIPAEQLAQGAKAQRGDELASE